MAINTQGEALEYATWMDAQLPQIKEVDNSVHMWPQHDDLYSDDMDF